MGRTGAGGGRRRGKQVSDMSRHVKKAEPRAAKAQAPSESLSDDELAIDIEEADPTSPSKKVCPLTTGRTESPV